MLTPPVKHSQEGIRGSTQGDKKEKRPATKARGTEISPVMEKPRRPSNYLPLFTAGRFNTVRRNCFNNKERGQK
jgi:hypothetical protein